MRIEHPSKRSLRLIRQFLATITPPLRRRAQEGDRVTTHLATANFLGLAFPVVQESIIPASVFQRGQLPEETGEGEEAPNAALAARLIRHYHASYATLRYGDAHVVDLPDDRFDEAHDRTRELIADPRTHAIVRPAFFWRDPQNDSDIGIGVRSGALVHRSDKENFTLTLLKAAKGVERYSRRVNASGSAPWKKELNRDYLLELALNVFVARASGVPVNKAGIVHLSGSRVFEGDLDPAAFFEFVDLTSEVNALEAGVKERIGHLQERHRHLLSLPAEAFRPPPTPPPTDISRLYVLKDALKERLTIELKLQDIRDIPDDFNARYPDTPLSLIQLRQVASLKQDRMIVEEPETLRRELQRLVTMAEGGCLSFFDLETIAPPVALIKGGKNGQTITLQFSSHCLKSDGRLNHHEILYDGDPLDEGALGQWDRQLAEAILEALGSRGPIIVYNASFEKTRLRELIRRLRDREEEELARRLERLLVDGALRDLADQLEGRGLTIFADQLRKVIGSDGLVKDYVEHLRTARGRGEKKKQPSRAALRLADEIEEALKADRFFDLLPLVRNHIYHPAFDGSFSLKGVLKALCDGKGYEDLEEIRDGEAATKALEEMLDPETTEGRKREIREGLLAYCGRDTEAEIWVLEKLFGAMGLPWPLTV